MRRGAILCLVTVAVVLGLSQRQASAHAALVTSEPAPGTMFEVAPTSVQLSFSEEPEASLSEIRVLDAAGTAYQTGPPQPVAGDRRSLAVPVRPGAKGLYTVAWRGLSRIDGHPTAGVFTFGIGVLPSQPIDGAATSSPNPSLSELAGRAALIAGLALLLGVACAAVAGFGSVTGGALGLVAWASSAIGVVLLADGQRRNAGGSIADLWATPVGRALAWRAVAILAAGGALVMARKVQPDWRRWTMGAVAVATAAAMAVDVASGHAAGTSSTREATVLAQWAHFAAVGVWLGGLAALLVGLRGAPSEAKAAAARRFSRVAFPALLVVVATGVVRGLGEVSTWGELTGTGYGRIVLLKVFLVVAILGLGAANRWRSVPKAATNLSGLRRTSGGEVVLASIALVAAGVLTTLAPPLASNALAATGLTVSGSDPATTALVTLRTQSTQPGPNVFTVRVVDYDTHAPIGADQVILRFTPLDDPGIAPSTLPLRAGTNGSFRGYGTNLAFDGRWRIAALSQGKAASVEVPLELDLRGPPQSVSVERVPGQPVRSTVQMAGGETAHIWAEPAREGPTKVYVAFADIIGDRLPVGQVVVTTTSGSGPTRQRSIQSLGTGQFVADATLPAGTATVAVVARTDDGARLRAQVNLEIAR